MMRLALALVLVAGVAEAEVWVTDTVLEARLVLPTIRYQHGVLGDATEWGGLDLLVDPCALTCFDGTPNHILRVTLPENRVFEDVSARVADVDGELGAEVVVVETDFALGASLAVYDAIGKKIAATPFIGQPNRWLAPAGIADFDGDGRVEIAYVDRPHLVRELVYVRLQGDRLVEVARLPGVTNHRIGDSQIAGGVRDCGQGVELVAVSPDWARLLVIGWQGGPVSRDAGTYSATAMAAALNCR